MPNWEEVKKREEKRFKEALDKARGTVFANRFPAEKSFRAEDLLEFERILRLIEGMILLGCKIFFEHLLSPLEKIRGRSIWEVYLSGAKHLARRYPLGEFRSRIGLKEWEGFPEKVDAFVKACQTSFSDFAELGREIEQYITNAKRANEIAAPYQKKDGVDYAALCRLYASLKTWKDNDLSRFQSLLEKSGQHLIEVIIEGPIQLYLLIGRDTWFLIIRVFTLERLSDFSSDKDQKELQDSNDLSQAIYDLLENSTKYKTFKEMLNEAVRLYIDDFISSQKSLRSQCPTQEFRRRFLERFEQGNLFQNS